MAKGLGNFAKGPDVSRTSRYGEPSLVDPEPETATKFVSEIAVAAGSGGDGKLNATVGAGKVGPNQDAPRSDNSTATSDASTTPKDQPAADAATAATPSANELTPNVADPNELKPNVEQDAALPPLQQSNELANGIAAAPGAKSSAGSSSSSSKEEMADISSSKKKKKKGIGKLNPF